MKKKLEEKSPAQRRRDKMVKIVGGLLAAVMVLTLMTPMLGF